MQLNVDNVRIAAAAACDFSMMRSYETEELLRAARPHDWRDYLSNASARRLIDELGVQRRQLTHVPGTHANAARLNALDLAESAVRRLSAADPSSITDLDALIFVSTSNPNPCNSMAALLAQRLGIVASCLDLKAGCSAGVFGLMQAALMIQGGCERVLLVMAENLSHLTSPADIRMLLTVGDGAACVLLERTQRNDDHHFPAGDTGLMAGQGPGFHVMLHGTNPQLASSMLVHEPFPPVSPGARYEYEIRDASAARDFLRARWRALYCESLAAAGIDAGGLQHWFFHQTHAAQVDELLAFSGLARDCTVNVVREHGNMGTPTFAVALAQRLGSIRRGDRYLVQAVGGGVSWGAIVAMH